MSPSPIRKLLRNQFRLALQRNSLAYSPSDLQRPAVIFSPHFDDETLGCGGVMLRKRKAHAAVNIVFMTDGSKSHWHRIAEDALQSMRMSEGLAAAAALGIDNCHVHCLGFEETQLASHKEAATAEALKILKEQQPEEIFLPHRCEPRQWSDDHIVTNEVVREAVGRWGNDVILYEYPIWFWFAWPWVAFPIRRRSSTKDIANNTLAGLFGLQALRTLNCAVDISDLHAQKMKALSQHKSQVSRPESDENWPILKDVANGEFLDCFFQPVELFYRSGYPEKAKS